MLDKYGVKVIGVQVDAIERGEDRLAFKDTMNRLGIDMPQSEIAHSVEEAEKIVERIGLPGGDPARPTPWAAPAAGWSTTWRSSAPWRPAGSRPAWSGQILVEESVLGWEELELEVVRDAKNQMITVCFIENVDAMGVHTGDSYCTAPMLTIAPELQERLQKYSYDIVEAIEVIGGTNIQFAHDPKTGRVVVIEINPRTSRSSALASKATGFPIAFVSSLLAGGLTLDEIPYWRDGTLEKYTPSGDYVVVKFSRWAFEKFRGVEDKLGTQMRAVGEVMSIGKTYKEAFQKSIRSLEIGRHGLGFAKNFNKLSAGGAAGAARPAHQRAAVPHVRGPAQGRRRPDALRADLHQALVHRADEGARRAGGGDPQAQGRTPARRPARAGQEGRLRRQVPGQAARRAGDARSASGASALGVVEGWHAVPVSGVENAAYYYSTYNAPDQSSHAPTGRKIMVLGGGPNRIGQGIEFDYCCVHAAFALRDEGYESIMVNCNPETVSTDYDTSDKLYFEPLTVEDVLSIYEKEKPRGVIVQFGGQTPLNLAAELAAAGVKILGTSPDMIDLAEDRDRFRQVMAQPGHPHARVRHGQQPGRSPRRRPSRSATR